MKNKIISIKKVLSTLMNYNMLEVDFTEEENSIYNKKVEYMIARINVARIIPISIILLIIELFYFMLVMLEKSYNKIFISIIEIIVLIIVFKFIEKSHKAVHKKDVNLNLLRKIYRLFWVVLLTFFLIFMLRGFYFKGIFKNPISMLFLIAVIPLFNIRERIVYLMFPIIIYIGGLVLNIIYLKDAIFYILLYGLFSFAISTILYKDMFKQIKVKLKLEDMNKELEIITNIDPLTRLTNRRGLRKTAERLWSNKNNKVSVAIIDIDFFKQYNDLYGHVEGDECLIKLAKAMSDVFENKAEEVARIGGEEFLVLFNNEEYEIILELLEKLMVDIEHLAIKSGKTDVSEFVTVSIGVTKPKEIGLNSWEDFYKKADEAMYEAKRTGRNKIVKN